MLRDEWGHDAAVGRARRMTMSARPESPTGAGPLDATTPRHRNACPDAPRPSVQAHRESVVRRLLARGVSAPTLIALLPDFRPVIDRLSGRR